MVSINDYAVVVCGVTHILEYDSDEVLEEIQNLVMSI